MTDLEQEIDEVVGNPPLVDVGDAVWFLFWRPTPMPGQDKAGKWEMTTARVISIRQDGMGGCIDLDNASAIPGGNGTWRFVEMSKIFVSRESAERTAKQLAPPVG